MHTPRGSVARSSVLAVLLPLQKRWPGALLPLQRERRQAEVLPPLLAAGHPLQRERRQADVLVALLLVLVLLALLLVLVVLPCSLPLLLLLVLLALLHRRLRAGALGVPSERERRQADVCRLRHLALRLLSAPTRATCSQFAS